MRIVAEIGSNWETEFDLLHSIEKAKLAGAHVAKFQLFTDLELYGSGKSWQQMGVTPYLNPIWIPTLADACKDVQIEFMCTAFSPKGYELIDQYVKRHKIASAEMTDTEILKTVNSFKKSVYLSTGGSSLEEIEQALKYLRDCPVTIMFCVGDYPARIVDFRNLELMREAFGNNYSYGYSDHSIDVINIPMLAKQKGCSVIEKHVNFTSHKDTPDAPHSLNFHEFEIMSRFLMGQAPSVVEVEAHANTDMKKRWKRKFVAIREISEGDKFILGDNVGIHRPKVVFEDPVKTFDHWEISGKECNKSKRVGDTICYSDVMGEVI